MQLLPGGSLITTFTVLNATGTPTNFDSAPTVTFYHNGIADTAWTSYTLTNVIAGNYVLSTTIPSGYALADEISIYVNGLVSTVAIGLVVLEAQLANTADNATLAAGQTFSTTGAVGSVAGNVSGSVGSVTGSVGSVTGNVGGNLSGSVGSVVGAVGSVTAAVTLPATVPAAYATSANQTTILSQTTAASIAGAVWNALLASYNVASSFGNWLQSLINAPTSSANATAAAAAILINPSDKLKTDVNGNVTFNNAIPVPPTTTQIQAALAAGTPLPAVLSASQDFNNTGQTTPYPTSGGGGGSGSAALSFTVKSTAAGTPVIPNATVSVIDASGAAVASGVTNGSGIASGMACAPGSYTYAVNAANFAGISGTLTPAPVAGNNPYVFSLTPNTLPIPSNPSECNVGIMIQEGAGQTGNVTITAIMTRVPPGSGNWFVGQTSTVVLVPGTQGYLTLYQNAQYSFSDGNTLIYQTIPPQTTWELPNTFS